MARKPAPSGPRLRVVIEPEVAIGPGKADLLEAIRDTGSISAAGRRLGMSYRRAWLLVDELNRHLGAPVVDAQTGGAKGGGAALTETGDEVLTRYRRMEQACRHVTEEDVAALKRLIQRNQRRK
ncbi:molybdate transport system regulatory protein [Dongia mobilis]|uniref:Molybdate transport system regulatory protein n=1 Tax=Dongia mobilis TaxID=578943 RepID=A0A4R6WW46_9PROT|nr:LysR family transcriptional regulator [Dongia mobilis]TDQ83897.1 molybdate transport system regulatory protein [Dongia mobilis]